MGEAQFLDPLSVGAEDGRVSAEFGLREDDADAHSRCNRVPSRMLPPSRMLLLMWDRPQTRESYRPRWVFNRLRPGGPAHIGSVASRLTGINAA
ncbi:hypothetical protein MSAS_34890 [Mycobacterium saskatchewanense]|nr:hypothetical protein MSAS_34890 [Mycobacterium saskatchewanense]